MEPRPLNVLFLCTGNSARSIMAEAVLNSVGQGRFHAFSAGSHPTGTVHPLALALLQQSRLPTEGLRSKSWDEFARPGAPELDFVFTVCDAAAGESCPLWPGQPVIAHWGVEDQAAVEGPQELRERAFRTAYAHLANRVRIFASLRFDTLDASGVKREVDAIGKALPG